MNSFHQSIDMKGAKGRNKAGELGQCKSLPVVSGEQAGGDIPQRAELTKHLFTDLAVHSFA